MSNISRREALLAGVGAFACIAVPTLPVVAAAAPLALPPTPAWIVGSEGEFNWQHIIADTQREALRIYADENGDYEEECDHEDYVEDCACCESICAYEAQRKPMWDGKGHDEIKPGDWLRAGIGHTCSRCSYETYPEENGHGVGDEAVCEDCMTLADWDIVDPEKAAEKRADLEDGNNRTNPSEPQP